MLLNDRFDLGILLRRGAILLDVRTHEEFVGWHLRGAVNIPAEELDNRLETLARWDTPLLVYSGKDKRSYRAARKLRLHGLEAYDAGEARSLGQWINTYGDRVSFRPPQA